MNVGQAITGTRHETERKVKDKDLTQSTNDIIRGGSYEWGESIGRLF